ncbi:hypothetical protein AB1Y20_001760 [Prymnesium parvum]|uniref:Uncharacterized protein n=1 Tax=Prymnesium parvum TaxID=97485 RepID=A0AB34KDE2_PRYPA
MQQGASSDVEQLLSEHEPETPKPDDATSRWHAQRSTWVIALSSSAAYALSYFWRYPIFLLPQQDLSRRVATLFGRDLDLHACFSLAFILGFGAAKAPAMSFAASHFFFSHRLACILALLVASMLIEGGGIVLFAAQPPLQVVAVFLSSFLSSLLFGLIVTYLEGRQATERMLAVMSGMLIYAGNLSRGAASAVLRCGVAPSRMPLVVGGAACPAACLLLLVTHNSPRPSAADRAARMRRTAMTAKARYAFLRSWALGIGALTLAYALLTGLRSVRDLYSKQIFAASLSVDQAPDYIFLIADLPGAILSVLALLYLNTISSNRRALLTMLAMMLTSTLLGLGSTLLFQFGILGGVAWQLSIGASIFVTYSVMGTPFFDRLLAASSTEGTCSFLIFLSDFCGYCASISLLLYRDFGPPPDDSPGSNHAGELRLFLNLFWVCGGSVVLLVIIAGTYFSRRLPCH